MADELVKDIAKAIEYLDTHFTFSKSDMEAHDARMHVAKHHNHHRSHSHGCDLNSWHSVHCMINLITALPDHDLAPSSSITVVIMLTQRLLTAVDLITRRSSTAGCAKACWRGRKQGQNVMQVIWQAAIL